MASSPATSLEAMSIDIWERIAFHTLVSRDSFLGPPSGLVSLLLISQLAYSKLSPINNYSLYAKLFRFKFDDQANERRFSSRWRTVRCLAAEFIKRCGALRRIRAEEFEEDDLWTCFLMLLENDGKNETQLFEWAHLHQYLDKVILLRVRRRPQPPLPWFQDPVLDSLLIWLLWVVTDRERVRSQHPGIRQLISGIIHPFVAAGYKYPTLYAFDSYFALPLCPHAERLSFGSGPPPMATITHYSHKLTVSAPLVVSAASLLYTMQAEELQSTQLLASHIATFPPDRATADLQGHVGPTQVDIIEFHLHTRIKPVERCTISLVIPDFDECKGDAHDESQELQVTSNQTPSQRFEEDWYRSVSCTDLWDGNSPLRGSVYRPGFMSGCWKGRVLQPEWQPMIAAALGQRSPMSVPIQHKPIYWDLEEYHCLHPNLPLSCGNDSFGGDNISRAWLPRGTSVNYLGEAIEIFDTKTSRNVRYERFIPRSVAPYSKAAFEKLQTEWISDDEESYQEIAETDPSLEMASQNPDCDLPDMTYIDDDDEYSDTVSHCCSGIADILVCGETTDRYRDAWGHFKLFGRVRSYDGLVVLLCEPNNPNQEHLGTWIFKGYVHDQNFVGRWRETSTPVDRIGYEGSFVVHKMSDPALP